MKRAAGSCSRLDGFSLTAVIAYGICHGSLHGYGSTAVILCGEGSLNCSSQTALIICRYGGLGYGAGTLFQGSCLYFAEDIAFKIGGADGTAVYLTFQGGSLYL